VTDIKICTEENSTTSSDIVICDEADTTEPSDIKICEDDLRLIASVNPCEVATTLSVFISEPVAVGDFIIGSGGVEPYSYTFDAGSVNASTGEILSITACSAPGEIRQGVVRVFDSCGNSTGVQTRLTGGQWDLITDTTHNPFFTDDGDEGCCTFGGGGDPCNGVSSITTGSQRFDETWGNVFGSGGCSCIPNCVVGSPWTSPPNPSCDPNFMCVQRLRTYKWQCP
jgi:hypothetical protein